MRMSSGPRGARRAVALFAFVTASAAFGGLVAHAQDTPELHTRPAHAAGHGGDQDADQDGKQGTPPPAVVATGHSDLPPQAEGEYPWDKHGGLIEIYFEQGQLHGYMTQHLDPDQRTAPVTFNFATTHVDGHAVEWTTRQVHNTSYSFQGHLERGVVASPAAAGYYLLTGTLTQHGGDADGLAQVVRYKRMPAAP